MEPSMTLLYKLMQEQQQLTQLALDLQRKLLDLVLLKD